MAIDEERAPDVLGKEQEDMSIEADPECGQDGPDINVERFSVEEKAEEAKKQVAAKELRRHDLSRAPDLPPVNFGDIIPPEER